MRRDDLRFVSLDATHLYEWAKAAGSIYQEELRRRLSEVLGVSSGEDRNGCREMIGFKDEQLRAFSKRTREIEAWLEANGSAAETPAEKRAMDDAAALATRSAKDPTLTPEVLRDRWMSEAHGVGLPTGQELVDRVCDQPQIRATPSADVVFAHITDPERGLCARDSRFGEAQVTAVIAAVGRGTFDCERIEELTKQFLASEHVVRLVLPLHLAETRPPQWSLVVHRQCEDVVLDALGAMATRMVSGAQGPWVKEAVGRLDLGMDQCQSIVTLCASGPALRALLSPAGHGKTTTLGTAAAVMRSLARPVVGLSTTHQAVGELRRAGIDAHTIASVLKGGKVHIPNHAVVVLDELSQCSTKDAAVLLERLRHLPGVMIWCAGDCHQAQSVAAGGLAREIEKMTSEGSIPAAVLTTNRRQIDPLEREALVAFRAGEIDLSQKLRSASGLEHELPNAASTTVAMADAVGRDKARLGASNVVALCVSHAEAEDLADVIRIRLRCADVIGGPELCGPGWSKSRSYCVGDRILLHDSLGVGQADLHNGDVLTIAEMSDRHVTVRTDDGIDLRLPTEELTGLRRDGTPKVSHAWARTIDGAQGGTWEQVHLLASPALDHERGYVGQSRGRRPTHTWYARRAPDADHGGRVANSLTVSEAVGHALARDGAKEFAASEDPSRLERILRDERGHHLEVLVRCLMGERDPSEEARRNERVDQIDRELTSIGRGWNSLRRDSANRTRQRPRGRTNPPRPWSAPTLWEASWIGLVELLGAGAVTKADAHRAEAARGVVDAECAVTARMRGSTE